MLTFEYAEGSSIKDVSLDERCILYLLHMENPPNNGLRHCTSSPKKMKSIMPTTPAAICFACHSSDNNVIVVAMDDSIIIVYNICLEEVISRLEGHSKRITGLAFCSILNVFVFFRSRISGTWMVFAFSTAC